MSDRELTYLCGLLNSYSKKATTHASFVVAGVFGVFIVLFNGHTLPLPMFFLSYVALEIIGVYAFVNFGYYSSLAHTTILTIEDRYGESQLKQISDGIFSRAKKESGLFRRAQWLRTRIPEKYKYGCIIVLWFFSNVLPFIYMVLKQVVGLAF